MIDPDSNPIYECRSEAAAALCYRDQCVGQRIVKERPTYLDVRTSYFRYQELLVDRLDALSGFKKRIRLGTASQSLRLAYRRLPLGELESPQALGQKLIGCIVYDFMGQNRPIKFEAIWMFESPLGYYYEPYMVPDEGYVLASIPGKRAFAFHEAMANLGVGAYIANGQNRRLARIAHEFGPELTPHWEGS